MKIKFLTMLLALLLLAGCSGDVALIEESTATPVPTQSLENKKVGEESDKRVTGGVKLIMSAPEDDESGLVKTDSYYRYEGEVLISIKNENTYKDEKTAKENCELLATMPESCVDVTYSGNVVTYYASVSAMEFMKEMKKEDIKKMGEEIGAEIEEF